MRQKYKNVMSRVGPRRATGPPPAKTDIVCYRMAILFSSPNLCKAIVGPNQTIALSCCQRSIAVARATKKERRDMFWTAAKTCNCVACTIWHSRCMQPVAVRNLKAIVWQYFRAIRCKSSLKTQTFKAIFHP